MLLHSFGTCRLVCRMEPRCTAACKAHLHSSSDQPEFPNPLPARRETLRCVARTALRTKLYEKLADQVLMRL